jgi:hypothetical protein
MTVQRSVPIVVLLVAMILPCGTVVAEDPSNAATEPNPNTPDASAANLKFSFRVAPWKGVLEWLAKESDLSLQLDEVPLGTFNFTDSHAYKPTEAVDLINAVLLTKGYTLLRRGRHLTVINLEDAATPHVLMELVPLVPVDQLAERGDFELSKCMFQLTHVVAGDVEQELRPLLGPQGTMLMLPAARQVLIVEFGGKLRMIKRVIEAMELQSGGAQPDELRLRSHPTSPADSTFALEVVQTLLAGEPGVRVAIDPKTGTLIAIASETHHARITATLQELQRGIPERSRIRVLPNTSRDIEELVANLQAIWKRDNNVLFVPRSATQQPLLREITPSRRHDSEAGRPNNETSPDRPKPSTRERPPTGAKDAGDTSFEGTFRPLPVGPVRLVPIEALDLLLIRGRIGNR